MPPREIQSAAPLSPAYAQMLYDSQKKSAWLAAVMNVVIAGSGFLYCGERFKALLVNLVFVAIGIMASEYEWDVQTTLTYIEYAIVLMWPLVFIDGFIVARSYNQKLMMRILQGSF